MFIGFWTFEVNDVCFTLDFTTKNMKLIKGENLGNIISHYILEIQSWTYIPKYPHKYNNINIFFYFK